MNFYHFKFNIFMFLAESEFVAQISKSQKSLMQNNYIWKQFSDSTRVCLSPCPRNFVCIATCVE